jgi:hypothetical protein
MKRTLVIHPFMFALWPILFVYSKNLQFIPFSQAWTSILVLLSFALMLFLLFTAILRNAMKAGAVLSLFLILFFAYGHIYSMLWEGPVTYAATNEALIQMITWATIFACGSALVLRIKSRWQDITTILNVMALTLVMISVIDIGIFEFKARTSRRDLAMETVEIAQVASVPTDTLPNIYYIILDAYGRGDVLEQAYRYDNSEFLGFLSEKGFFIADKSLANYAQTDLSLASSLNLTYLDDLATLVGSESWDRRPLENMIQKNAVVRFLEQHGYTIVGLASGFSATDLRNSEVHIGSGRTWNELEIRLLCSTPIPWLAIKGSVFDPYAAHRQKVLHTINHIADASRLPGPYFVFAHVLAPHGPFVFDEYGNEIAPQKAFDLGDGIQYDEHGQISEEYLKGYTGQLTFINSKIKSVLENLLSQSSRPTIVILQSDHGPGSPLDWEDPDNPHLQDRFAILNAYLLPGKHSASLYEEITPVNTFRLIFNQYFGTALEQLEDESYFSTWTRPYEFINVTHEVQSDGARSPSE